MDFISRVNFHKKIIFKILFFIKFRNAELWSVNLDELPPSYVPPERDRTWGLGWFKK
jgi:hypothetical protein